MSAERNFTDQDYERLSAYLDGALNEAERADLEARLQSDDGLRRELEALRQTVNLVRALPLLKAPRNFTLTPSMVRQRPARWLIFPTSAAFSGLAAAAATILILIGVGTLFLQNTPAAAPNFGAQPVSDQQEAASQIANLPTGTAPISEKTAEREQQATLTSATNENLPMTQNALPSPIGANGGAAADNTGATVLQTPQANTEEQPAPSPSDGSLGYTTAVEPTIDDETAQLSQAAPPISPTLSFSPTMPPPSPPAIAPGAADTAAQIGGNTQPEQPITNAQSSAPAEIMTDQLELQITGTAVAATFGGDAFARFTATAPAAEAYAALPSQTPPPSPTTVPTLTKKATVTTTPTPTPAPTQTLTPVPTSTLDRRVAESPSPSPDLLTWGALILGGLLLIIAVGTTIIRRRGR